MMLNQPKTAQAGVVPETATTQTDNLGRGTDKPATSTRTFSVTDHWQRQQSNPLNGWNDLDGAARFDFDATDGFDALRQWAAMGLDDVPPISDWPGMQVAAATGFSHDHDDLTIDRVDQWGFTATNDDLGVRLVVDVADITDPDLDADASVADDPKNDDDDANSAHWRKVKLPDGDERKFQLTDDGTLVLTNNRGLTVNTVRTFLLGTDVMVSSEPAQFDRWSDCDDIVTELAAKLTHGMRRAVVTVPRTHDPDTRCWFVDMNSSKPSGNIVRFGRDGLPASFKFAADDDDALGVALDTMRQDFGAEFWVAIKKGTSGEFGRRVHEQLDDLGIVPVDPSLVDDDGNVHMDRLHWMVTSHDSGVGVATTAGIRDKLGMLRRDATQAFADTVGIGSDPRIVKGSDDVQPQRIWTHDDFDAWNEEDVGPVPDRWTITDIIDVDGSDTRIHHLISLQANDKEGGPLEIDVSAQVCFDRHQVTSDVAERLGPGSILLNDHIVHKPHIDVLFVRDVFAGQDGRLHLDVLVGSNDEKVHKVMLHRGDDVLVVDTDEHRRHWNREHPTLNAQPFATNQYEGRS